MIIYTDITSFMSWFMYQTGRIAANMMSKMDGITFGATSLLKIIITITVLQVFLGIILNSTRGTANKIYNTTERKKK